MNEIFKDIIGYENLYQVSNLGNVKSFPKGDGNGNRTRLLKQEVVKCNHTNYNRVAFSKNGHVRRFSVHRLVATAFVDLITGKEHVNHIDNNGENNHYENLEWVTHSENMQHSQNQGRLFASQSKAGKAAGKIQHEKMLKSIDLNIGLFFGRWMAIGYAGKHGKKQNAHLICRCECGKVKNIGMSDLVTGHSTGCKSCALRKYPIKDKYKTIITQSDLSGKIINSFNKISQASIKTGYSARSISRWILTNYRGNDEIWTREKLKI